MPVIYQTSTEIPSFGGINQSGDGYNMSMRYATEATNVDVSGGSFAPMRKGQALKQKLEHSIGTLACLSRRYGVDSQDKNLLVAISSGSVYTKILDKDDEWVERYTGLSTDNCDYVTYEVNTESTTVDVLLFTNAYDGMFCLWGDDMHVEKVPTPYKFGVLERHNERIWGSGVIDYPDVLVYSAPFNPYNWEQNTEIPEDGAGEIMQPTWDGDSFVALRSYGSQLLAFKKGSIFRVMGTDPGQFAIYEQYGGGTIEENTIAVNSSSVFMLGYGGLVRYDGSSTTPFQQEAVAHILGDGLNKDYVNLCTSVMKNDKTYLIAFPYGTSKINNAVLEYDASVPAFSLRTDIYVKDFLRIEDRLFYTSFTDPGRVYELNGKGDVMRVDWKSGYQDLGIKSSVKSAFTLYYKVEAEVPFELDLSIRTEKKIKTKHVWIKPGKAMRTNVNVQGRYFRLEIASDSVIPYKIVGGIKIDLELDPD